MTALFWFSVLWHHWGCTWRGARGSFWWPDICAFWHLHRWMDLHRIPHHNDWCRWIL